MKTSTPLVDRSGSRIKQIHLVEDHVKGKPLGRHVKHDPRSRLFPAPGGAEVKSVRHLRLVPPFDQGDVGSCTGNAAIGCASTAPFTHKGTEKEALSCYSDSTHLDTIKGIYPPNDTGSDGLSVMKVLKNRGLISGYTHAFSADQVFRALQLVPGITGITWLSGCDKPNSSGVVKYRGLARGGHEIELVGLDMVKGLVWFCNSWGLGWGLGGYFAMTLDDYAKALADNGDATFPKLSAAHLAKLLSL